MLLKAWLPVVECPSAYVSFTTRFGHIASRFPGLKEQFALLRSRKWKVYVFGSHPIMIPEFANRSKCCCPLQSLTNETRIRLATMTNERDWSALQRLARPVPKQRPKAVRVVERGQ